MIAHMLCRSAAEGLASGNTAATSAIFTMCQCAVRPQRAVSRRQDCRTPDRELETSHYKLSSATRCLNAGIGRTAQRLYLVSVVSGV